MDGSEGKASIELIELACACGACGSFGGVDGCGLEGAGMGCTNNKDMLSVEPASQALCNNMSQPQDNKLS